MLQINLSKMTRKPKNFFAADITDWHEMKTNSLSLSVNIRVPLWLINEFFWFRLVRIRGK